MTDREWRGLGVVPQSGLALRPEYAAHDAALRFPETASQRPPPKSVSACPAAKVLLGKMQPPNCPHFGNPCTPDNPLGAPMVSPEGPCAAFYLHRPAPNSTNN